MFTRIAKLQFDLLRNAWLYEDSSYAKKGFPIEGIQKIIILTYIKDLLLSFLFVFLLAIFPITFLLLIICIFNIFVVYFDYCVVGI